MSERNRQPDEESSGLPEEKKPPIVTAFMDAVSEKFMEAFYNKGMPLDRTSFEPTRLELVPVFDHSSTVKNFAGSRIYVETDLDIEREDGRAFHVYMTNPALIIEGGYDDSAVIRFTTNARAILESERVAEDVSTTRTVDDDEAIQLIPLIEGSILLGYYALN